LPQGYSYMISIDAVNGWELKTRGDTVFTNTLGEIDTIPPSIPQNVKVTNTTKSSISLSWDKSTDNEVVSGYLIGVLNESRTKYYTAFSYATQFIFGGLDSGIVYEITISAYDGSFNYSPLSEP